MREKEGEVGPWGCDGGVGSGGEAYFFCDKGFVGVLWRGGERSG